MSPSAIDVFEGGVAERLAHRRADLLEVDPDDLEKVGVRPRRSVEVSVESGGDGLPVW